MPTLTFKKTLKKNEYVAVVGKKIIGNLLISDEAVNLDDSIFQLIPNSATPPQKPSPVDPILVEAVLTVYPKLPQLLTQTQLGMFALLYNSENGVTNTQLAACLKFQSPEKNNIAVHISQMRIKFRNHNFPFTIKTIKAGQIRRETIYKLEPTK